MDEHIALLKTLQEECDLLPSTIDAYTRLNRYEEAAVGIQKSIEAGTSKLNGLPVVNHGVAACRRMTESLEKPIQVRHGTPDARLLAEIAMASGFTSYEGGGISYNIPYAKTRHPGKIHSRLAVLRPSDGSVRRERHSHQP
ncbi:Methylaspartate mutase, E subunit [Citrobacter freundii]|uniref:Methylaspartate mutase, E subunit n=1 Tax=Citrobacter freundii TaxID=546 RepID=A0A7G2IHN2_CITFR|nr:Methylaspartate mutase, E subunit [Citrobacter freundii]